MSQLHLHEHAPHGQRRAQAVQHIGRQVRTHIGSRASAASSTPFSRTYQPGDGLHFVEQNGITGSFDGSNGTLVLSGTATVAQYEAALGSVTFQTSNILAASRLVSLSVSDALVTSNIQTVTVNSAARLDLAGLNGINGFVLYGVDMLR